MEILQAKNYQINGLQEKLTKLITGLPRSKNIELDISNIEQLFKEYQNAYDEASIELNNVHLDSRIQFQKDLREHKNTKKGLQCRFETAKNEVIRKDLITITPQQDMVTNESMMSYGLRIQDQSRNSLQNTIRVISDTQDIGITLVAHLECNTEQIANMRDKLDSIDSTLIRSTNILKRITKKIVTDRYVCCVITLVIVAIIFIIIWQTFKLEF